MIINPKAKAGTTKKKISIIKRLLDSEKINSSYYKTRSAGDEINIVRRVVKDGFRKFICVGGDGTIQKIIAGIQIQKVCDPKKIVVGIIPLGTGNDWAKSIEIPLNIKRAVKKIKEGKTNTYCHEVKVNGPSVIKYGGNDKPLLSCGARVVIQTDSEIDIIR